MKSDAYYRRREKAWQKQQIKDDQKRMAEIKKRLQYAQDRIQDEINANWSWFTKREKISIAEAKKAAAKMDVQKFARKAKQYVKEKDFSQIANDQLRLYNLTMRVNRLELLKANIGLELVAAFDDLDKYFTSELSDAALEEMKRQAGILGLTVPKLSYEDLMGQIVDGSFHDEDYPTFSETLWQYQSELKAQLDVLLQQSITQGRHPKDLSPALYQLMTKEGRENAKYNAQRLLVTEMTTVQTEIQRKSYRRAAIEKYEFIAEPGACKYCLDLNGEIFWVTDMQPGTNAPNMHPFCRCSTAPVVKEK